MAVQQITLEVNQHDDKRFYLNLTKPDGSDAPVADFTDVIFIIAPTITTAELLRKSLVAGTIIASDVAEVYFDLSRLETGAFDAGSYYCEVRGILTAGNIHQTMGGGSFTVVDTHIGDYP